MRQYPCTQGIGDWTGRALGQCSWILCVQRPARPTQLHFLPAPWTKPSKQNALQSLPCVNRDIFSNETPRVPFNQYVILFIESISVHSHWRLGQAHYPIGNRSRGGFLTTDSPLPLALPLLPQHPSCGTTEGRRGEEVRILLGWCSVTQYSIGKVPTACFPPVGYSGGILEDLLS